MAKIRSSWIEFNTIDASYEPLIYNTRNIEDEEETLPYVPLTIPPLLDTPWVIKQISNYVSFHTPITPPLLIASDPSSALNTGPSAPNMAIIDLAPKDVTLDIRVLYVWQTSVRKYRDGRWYIGLEIDVEYYGPLPTLDNDEAILELIYAREDKIPQHHHKLENFSNKPMCFDNCVATIDPS